MQLRTKISTALVLPLGLCSSLLLAEAGQFYVAPGLQWMNFDDSLELNNDAGYFLGLGYDITDRISLELSTFDLDPDISGGSDIDVDHYKLDLVYNLDLKLGALDTFVVFGVGNTNFQGENDSLWDLGAGVKYKLSDNLTWRTAFQSFRFLGRDLEDSDYGVGMSLVHRLGGKKPRSAVAATAAPASPATGSAGQRPATQAPVAVLDADRDGIPDGRDNCPDTPRNYAVDADGCPIPIEEVARVELLVNFDFDRSEVKPEYFSEIEEVTDFMHQYPDMVVELEGHTDSRGAEQYNLGLSDRRANAVREVMIDRFNVQASRISASGFGESQPVASNDTDSGRAQNRRVVTVIIKTLQNYRPR